MINLKEELKNYQPIDINILESSGARLNDNAKNSIVLYNKALESLKMGSEDIAIIELRKAISSNPEFYEAVNLLGVCYSFINENSKAIEMFQKVVAAENNSIMALRYLNMLDSGGTAQLQAQKPKKKDDKARRSTVSGKDGSGRTSTSAGGYHRSSIVKRHSSIGFKKDIVKYSVGFAMGALIVLVLSLVFIRGGGESMPQNGIEENKLLAQKNTELEDQYNKLSNDYKALQKNLDAANENVDYYKVALKLYEAESLFGEGRLEEAADMLLLMKTVDLKNGEKEKFQRLYDSIMPQAAKKLFQEGQVLVNSKKKYNEALEKLNKIQLYSHDFNRMDAVLYYTGKCYQQLNDSRNALGTYQRLIKEYPQSSYVKWASSRVRELTELP